jgi:hypothetical protein
MSGPSLPLVLPFPAKRTPDQSDPHLVDLGNRKWDPNAPADGPRFLDWYGVLSDPANHGRLLLALLSGPAELPWTAEPDWIVFVDQKTGQRLESPETVAVYNFFWERLVNSYRDPLCAVGRGESGGELLRTSR